MSNEDTPVLDALGNAIEIDKRYGYATTSSGWSKTSIGTAAKITATGKVTLRDLITKTYLYGKLTDTIGADSDVASIQAHKVFPVPPGY
jgi:hypothetical protein